MRQHSKKIIVLGALLALFGASQWGCNTFAVKTPSGYVKYKRSGEFYKAVAPDNALIVIRSWDNDPRGTLQFWSDTLKRDLAKVRGYKFVKDAEIKNGQGKKGRQLVFEGTYRGRMYRYEVALFVTKKRIYALQTLIEKDHLAKHPKVLEKVVATFKPL
jgi:hypothetical protein